MEFIDKVALVAGGGSGIGRATACHFAQQGAKVVIGDLSLEGAEETASLIREAGGEAIARKTDVTQAADVDALVAAAVTEFGGLDFAAHVAGYPHLGSMFDSEELWDKVIAVNLTGILLCSRAAATAMKARGGGAIVNISSTSGIESHAQMPFYNAAKHGVIGLSKSMALELARYNIRLNIVCPGFTVTPMTMATFGDHAEAFGAAATPLGRAAQPIEQAEIITWLCSDRARFMTGSIVVADGGLIAGRMAE